ncbi:MAG: hypothetical protein WA790_18700 [Sulfitobacter sp.]
MTQTALDQKLAQLEREMSHASAAEKAQIAQRIRALLAPEKAKSSGTMDEGEDLFDNMPV